MMTPEQWAEATVRIATGLLGWEKKDSGPHGDDFRLCKPTACVTFTKNYRSIMHEWSANGEGPYLPDLTTLDGCAEFERELARMEPINGTRDVFDLYHGYLEEYGVHPLLATPEQRVQACLRVMEEERKATEEKVNGSN